MAKTNKNFNGSKPINYLSKDFSAYKDNLLEFIKTYYPNTYKDFNEGSTGMMMVDMMAYVGDVLSYYTDFQFNESFLTNAVERENIISAAKFLGYVPKLIVPSVGSVDVYQVIPSVRDSSGNFIPDYKFALLISDGMKVSTTDNKSFITTSPIDFSSNTLEDPLEISVFSRNDSDEIDTFLLKKSVPIESGEIVTQEVVVGDASIQFLRESLNRNDAYQVLSVVDSDGNKWYEVDWLAQDIVFTEIKNVSTNEKELSRFRNSVPYILGSLKTSRKFITGIADGKMYLEFGSGDGIDFADETIQSINVANRNYNKKNPAVDPSTFLRGRSYGEIPRNTVLTITYLAGGGERYNVGSEEIVKVSSVEYAQENLNDITNSERELFNSIKNSLRVINTEPISGGKGEESSEQIRQNALAFFNAQNRVVSAEDYIVRTLSMPSRFGNVAKVHVASEDELQYQSSSPFVNQDKSFSVNMFTLAYDSNKKLTIPNKALIENLKTYLRKNRMLTDDITVYNGNIINIGLEFEIIAFKGENKQEVLFECIESAKSFFNIDNMDFNQPINLGLLELYLANVDGVQSVSKLTVRNLTAVDGDYSVNKYSIQSATKNNMIYPSLDPSIFEVKFPDKDIKGKVL